MASDGNPGSIVSTSLVQGSQASTVTIRPSGGKSVPGGNIPPISAGAAAVGVGNTGAAGADSQSKPNAGSLVIALNKFLNESGRPDQFRIDPDSRNTLIQEVNPATGEVIGEYSVAEFPELARSVGATSLLIDSHA